MKRTVRVCCMSLGLCCILAYSALPATEGVLKCSGDFQKLKLKCVDDSALCVPLLDMNGNPFCWGQVVQGLPVQICEPATPRPNPAHNCLYDVDHPDNCANKYICSFTYKTIPIAPFQIPWCELGTQIEGAITQRAYTPNVQCLVPAPGITGDTAS